MDLPKLSTPELRESCSLGPEIAVTASGFLESSPYLLVSDNPETIDRWADGGGILGEFWLTNPRPAAAFRLFFWHLNQTGKTLQLGVTLENAGDVGAEIGRIVHAVETDANRSYLAVGKRIAEGLLSGGDAVFGDTSVPLLTLPPKQRTLLRVFPWEAGRLIGGEIEVLLRGVSTNLDTIDTLHTMPPLIVRTVCAPAGADLLSITNPLIDIRQTHPYGVWPGSEMQINAALVLTGPNQRAQLRLATKGDGAVAAAFPAEAVVPGSVPDGRIAISNPAGFGGIFRVHITLSNPSGRDRMVRVLLSPRGGDFAGAACLPGGAVVGIPYLKAGVEAANLETVPVRANTLQTIDYAFTVAGAAATPFALCFQTE